MNPNALRDFLIILAIGVCAAVIAAVIAWDQICAYRERRYPYEVPPPPRPEIDPMDDSCKLAEAAGEELGRYLATGGQAHD